MKQWWLSDRWGCDYAKSIVFNIEIWYNNIKFTLPTESAVRMLYLLEIYASQCYDNTQLHIKSVSELTNIDDIERYDYTTGYPGKLKF